MKRTPLSLLSLFSIFVATSALADITPPTCPSIIVTDTFESGSTTGYSVIQDTALKASGTLSTTTLTDGGKAAKLSYTFTKSDLATGFVGALRTLPTPSGLDHVTLDIAQSDQATISLRVVDSDEEAYDIEITGVGSTMQSHTIGMTGGKLASSRKDGVMKAPYSAIGIIVTKPAQVAAGDEPGDSGAVDAGGLDSDAGPSSSNVTGSITFDNVQPYLPCPPPAAPVVGVTTTDLEGGGCAATSQPRTTSIPAALLALGLGLFVVTRRKQK